MIYLEFIGFFIYLKQLSKFFSRDFFEIYGIFLRTDLGTFCRCRYDLHSFTSLINVHLMAWSNFCKIYHGIAEMQDVKTTYFLHQRISHKTF